MHLDLVKDFTKEQIEYLKTLSKSELLELKSKLQTAASSNNTAQINRKLLINSLYGAMGNIYSRLYDLRNATAITLYGQLAIQWTARKVNESMNTMLKTSNVDYVTYADTDSLYLVVDDIVALVMKKKTFKTDNELVDFLDDFSKTKMQSIIDDAMQELFEYMNNFENLMAMDREVISMPSLKSSGLGGFWTAKKRYALNVYDSEGTRYAKPKLKILGLETQRSSTPEALRDVLKESIRVMLQEGESALHEQVDSFRGEYHQLHYTEIAKVTSANNLAKYSLGDTYISGTPGHVRGSLLYNRLIKERGLNGATPIQEGSKVMEVVLKTPNPWQEKTICWPSGLELPSEIEDEIISYMDYNEQFEKTFIKPLETMTSACGIKHEHVNDLSSFFNF